MKHVYKCIEDGRVRYVEDPSKCKGRVEFLMDGSRRTALSKLMTALLRHIPWEAGLKLDSEGWIKIDDLIRGIREVWRNKHLYQWVTRDHILAIAALDPKGRFEIRDNYIRACYGHSIKADLKYKEDTKVKILYHGTTEEAWAKIRYEGLKPGRRLWVHLSGNINDAYEVARRHGSRIVILLIDIECLRRRGIKIFKASKSVWVVKYVPPECIKRIR